MVHSSHISGNKALELPLNSHTKQLVFLNNDKNFEYQLLKKTTKEKHQKVIWTVFLLNFDMRGKTYHRTEITM